jgi:hypothetical protein
VWGCVFFCHARARLSFPCALRCAPLKLPPPPKNARRALRHAMPPACTMLEAPLKHVVMTRFQSVWTGVPSEYLSFLGTQVQPRRTPLGVEGVRA